MVQDAHVTTSPNLEVPGGKLTSASFWFPNDLPKRPFPKYFDVSAGSAHEIFGMVLYGVP